MISSEAVNQVSLDEALTKV